MICSSGCSIFATVSSVKSTRTPCTTDYIMSILDQMIPWINSFTKRRMGVSSRLRKPPIPICFAQATSLLAINLCNLSILIKMTFLSEIDTTYFSHWFALFKVIFRSKSYSTSLED